VPWRDADAATAERVRRNAVDAFVDTHAAGGRPWHLFAPRIARAITSVVVAGTVGVYLTWAVSAANALFP
jgi:hypothetical protein